ncbi:MAG: DUF4386 domain-containing protein [Anaerolineae bacterium]|nr:DUF4386 domain-containing protein [Anaerolineae bacterium]
MYTNKMIARTVGVLYIIGTVALVLSAILAGTILDDPDYLIEVSANKNQIILGVLLVLISGFALAMIPVFMFPLLRKHNETLALGYVVFRSALETITHFALVIVWLLLLTLSQEYVKAGTPNASSFQPVGTVLREAGDWIGYLMAYPFCLGALIFYYLLYQTKLVPRWISGWGLIGAILYLVAPLAGMFGSELGIVMAPLGVQEMVLAVWLIVKGFNPSAITSGSASLIGTG